MSAYGNTLKRLELSYATLSPQLRRAAKWILDHPETVAFGSVRSLAHDAGVTSTTMVRLAKQLGFERYEEFREGFRRKYESDTPSFTDRARWLREMSRGGVEAELVHEVAVSSLTNLEELFRETDPALLTEIADRIRQAPHTHLLAAGAPRWVTAAFQTVAYMAAPRLLPPRTSGASIIDDFLSVRPGDLALCIMVQPYLNETAKAADFAKRRGATIVALTDSRASPLAPLADYFVKIPTNSPQFFPSLIAIMAVLETLTALMVARCDGETSQRIEEFDRLRRAEGLCWEPGGQGGQPIGEMKS
jgi:DNA-binding MurR/RpiR family transcriptional regulator